MMSDETVADGVESFGLVEYKALLDKLRSVGELDKAAKDILIMKFDMLSIDDKIEIINRAYREVVCEVMSDVEAEVAIYEAKSLLDMRAWFVKSVIVLMTCSMIGFLVIQIIYNEESGFMTSAEAFAAIYGVINELILGGGK